MRTAHRHAHLRRPFRHLTRAVCFLCPARGAARPSQQLAIGAWRGGESIVGTGVWQLDGHRATDSCTCGDRSAFGRCNWRIGIGIYGQAVAMENLEPLYNEFLCGYVAL